MKKSTLSKLLGTVLLTTIGTGASAAPKAALRGKDTVPWSRMHKAHPTQRWSNSQTEGLRQKRVSPNFTTPASDAFEYIYAPDGSLWYAVTSYDTEDIRYEYYTEHEKKGFTITFYDSKFNEIGKIRDKIQFQEGETKCADVSLGSQITQKFFNYDGNYEVMVSLFMNTPDYTVNSRTVAYSITDLGEGETSTPITTVPGYPVDEVNCARDKWSEDFYITFLTEEQAGDPDDYDSYIDFLGGYKSTLTTYGKEVKPVMEKTIRNLDLPGDQMSSPAMLCKNVDGHLTLVYARYEKTFFENPAGQSENENVTPDNNLIIETYRMNDAYPREMELLCTTKIETVQNTDKSDVYCSYYGIGNLMWNKDVDFDNYTTDGRPSFIISVDDYLFSDDDHYNSGYYVYDADGNRIKTIAENTFDFVMMSDIPGFEPQAMFIHTGDDMNFEFVDLYSCERVTTIDCMYRGYALSTSLDRVASGDSYVYASALSTGLPLDDDQLAAPVCWIDSNGEFIRLDMIPTGEGVELAQIYMNADGLKPFLFNTDNDLEYMLLVKRNVDGLSTLREELLIASTEKGVLHTFTDDDVKGNIRSVMLMPGKDPELLIVYQNDNYIYSTDAYSLPFSRFAGGSGTAADPYLIATGGDLQQIKTAPGAFYKLTDDIDCSGLDFQSIDEFTGTLDGDGHTVRNLRLFTQPNGKTGIFTYTDNATVRNIDFYNATMLLSGAYEAGLIAATAGNTSFENIHIRRLTATGDSYSGEFGGIAGKMWTMSAITGCEVAGADIYLPSCPSAGGMTGDIRTGCKITSCAFSGNMTAQNTLGGIVGSTTTGDETISFCHVNANLKAENTIGGIVGFLDRSKVKSNFVEGTLEATKLSKWSNAISLGGIAGELEGDWQGNADVPVVQNLIGVTSFTFPSLEGVQAQDPRQLATVHRIVGRSSYNAYFEEEPSKVVAENGVYNNYVVSDLAVMDQDYANNNIEGTTISKDEVDDEWLTANLGFAYGETDDAPWNMQSWPAYNPSLHYESIVYIPYGEICVDKGADFEIEIAVLSLAPISEEDIKDAFMCEYDETVLEMNGAMNYDGKTLRIGMTAIGKGESDFSADILGDKARCLVKVNDSSAVDGIVNAGSALGISNGILSAEGCAITVYDLYGKILLKGIDRVDSGVLNAGVYVAIATDKAGMKSSLKFAK